ncbi:hypothetical protein KDA_41280 [Dictyobacter alpinus]|uniref:Uncharacterized protein n=2 Tax=Dictyobacter alpinus TaxID=2014873 RepID=A0A402BBC6_9CHLR|nr:hypothetical protein KDA_41280 [Dictyobacter alpinus]
MPFLRDFIGQPLQWKRTRLLSTTYELRSGDQVLATINRASTTRASAEAEGKRWSFQREGLRKLLVHPGEPQAADEADQSLASIQLGGNWNGTLTFQDGHFYTWTRSGIWRPSWSWKDAGNQILLTLKKGRSLEIAAAASNLPDLALLALFGLCLIFSMEDDDATLTAATSVVIN